MSLWKIAWRSMQQRALASTLTGLSMALGVALVIAVLVIHGVVKRQFSQDAQGYDLIVGAKGGKLQLVLNTVYHLSQPIENIPYSFYKEFTEGEFAEYTELAIPYCLGDSYRAGEQSFRVVGTTPEMFDRIVYGRRADGTDKQYEFEPGGRNFKNENFYEGVIGSVVARQSGLKVGDTLSPTHGIDDAVDGHAHDAFTVVGILKPTGTANDRAVFINIEGFYLLENHAKASAETGVTHDEEAEHGDEHDESTDHDHADHTDHEFRPLAESQREVTAVLVLCSNLLYPQEVFTKVNEGQVAQAVFPAREVSLLLERLVGPMQLILLVLTVLIVVVASIGIMVSIYNSMSERSRDIAVMRALGADRRAVMVVILLESILLSLVGGAAGVVLGHACIGLAGPYVAAQTGVALGFLQFDMQEFILIPGLVILATLVGFLPAMAAYRTDVAKSLSANP